MSTFSILICLLVCGWAERSSAATVAPTVNSLSVGSMQDEIINPRIQLPWITNFTSMILENIANRRRQAFYIRIVKREWRKVSCFALKLTFCLPTAVTYQPFSTFMTNSTQRKLAAFFIDRHWMRLDRMVAAEEIFQFAIQTAVDLFRHKKWMPNKSRNKLIKHIWQHVFSPLETYLNSDPNFEEEFANFETYYDEKIFEVVQNFQKRYVRYLKDTTASAYRNVELAFLDDGYSEFFNRSFPIFWSFFQNEHKRGTNLYIQQIFLKIIPLTYRELRNKENEELERIIIAEAVLQLGEENAETRKMAQKLYDDVILETAEKFDQTNYPEGVRAILFEKLQSKFESAPELGNKFLQAKQDVKSQMLVMHNGIADFATYEFPL